MCKYFLLLNIKNEIENISVSLFPLWFWFAISIRWNISAGFLEKIYLKFYTISFQFLFWNRRYYQNDMSDRIFSSPISFLKTPARQSVFHEELLWWYQKVIPKWYPWVKGIRLYKIFRCDINMRRRMYQEWFDLGKKDHSPNSLSIL